MKKTICTILAGIMSVSMLMGSAITTYAEEKKDDISIGVSIWGTSDPLGASCKKFWMRKQKHLV